MKNVLGSWEKIAALSAKCEENNAKLIALADEVAEGIVNGKLPVPEGYYVRQFEDGRRGLYDIKACAPFGNRHIPADYEMALRLAHALKRKSG